MAAGTENLTGAAAAAAERRAGLRALALGALGVVFGDIGTSPLYAIDQIFFGPARVAPTPVHVIGAISLAIWTITLIVAVKYAALVLRAENEGEGGVFALYGLVYPFRDRGGRPLMWALMLGAGLLFGDGMITPAISVVSAVEGLNVITPAFGPYVAPIALALLTALFAIQYKGAGAIGRLFGPLMVVWFAAIAILGLRAIVREPAILWAFEPSYGIAFLFHAGWREALMILSAMMLVVTGGEAMYADLGHFGAQPIRLSWFSVVFPALLLNYLGQGALLLSGAPIAAGNLFYSMAPTALVGPLVVLATLATVIASQALITGAFSLAAQAIGLGLFPRLDIRHTHHMHAGQIYLPFVNWLLYIGCVALVIGFGSASALAAAYGLAVAGVMLITSVAMIFIARRYWRWGWAVTWTVWGALTLVNAGFLVASSVKFLEGGFVPVSVSIVAFVVMSTWKWGRRATFAAYAQASTMTMQQVVELHRASKTFMERNALLMSPLTVKRATDRAPALVSLFYDRFGMLPRNLVIVEVTHPRIPYVLDHRYHVTVFDRDDRRGSVIAVELRFGFMEEPNVERRLADLARHHKIDLPSDPAQWTVHVSHENLMREGPRSPWRQARFRLYMILRQVSRPAYYAYGLGDEVRLTTEILPVNVR